MGSVLAASLSDLDPESRLRLGGLPPEEPRFPDPTPAREVVPVRAGQWGAWSVLVAITLVSVSAGAWLMGASAPVAEQLLQPDNATWMLGPILSLLGGVVTALLAHAAMMGGVKALLNQALAGIKELRIQREEDRTKVDLQNTERVKLEGFVNGMAKGFDSQAKVAESARKETAAAADVSRRETLKRLDNFQTEVREEFSRLRDELQRQSRA